MNVNHPNYYQITTKDGKQIECEDLIDPLTEGMSGSLAYWYGCLLKYAFRWNRKHDTEEGKLADLEKLKTCVQRMIDILSTGCSFPNNPYGVEVVPCGAKSPTDTTGATDEEIQKIVNETKRGTTHDIADSQSLRDGCVMFECEQCHDVFEFTEQDYLAVKFCPHCGRQVVHDNR
jgi:hypothetical protein